MRQIFALALGLFVLPFLSAAQANTDDAPARTKHHVIQSSVLGEDRTIYVRTPPRYDASKSYPVVYVLDGEWNFEYVASYLDYMIDNEVYPDVIVAAIRNVSRNRDYVPAPDPNHAHTGQAGTFLTFVAEEWIPFVEKTYPASGKRVLTGHSFGGVFTLHSFFNKPDLFDAYIALGSSAWIAERKLFDEADALFARRDLPPAFVYMAVGEGDGGPTVPSSRDLAAIFGEKAPPQIEWTFSITPKTDHFKNMASGLHDGFMALFPAWGFANDLKAGAEANGPEGVKTWFAEKEESLGWRFKPAWFDLSITAFDLVRDGQIDAALAIMEELRRFYPHSAYIASFSGVMYLRAGQLDLAEAETKRAIKLARNQGLDPNALQIESLEGRLGRINRARTQGN